MVTEQRDGEPMPGTVETFEKRLPYGDVAEIVETGARGANQYIQHGYVLLGIFNVASARSDPKGGTYVAKRPVYVLGRAADVPSWVVGQDAPA